jgi:hypothetical protein
MRRNFVFLWCLCIMACHPHSVQVHPWVDEGTHAMQSAWNRKDNSYETSKRFSLHLWCLYVTLISLGFKFQQGQEVYLCSQTSILALGPTQPPIQWHQVSFLRVQWPVRDVYHSLPLPCSAEVKNMWTYTSTTPLCLHGTDKEFLGHSDVN